MGTILHVGAKTNVAHGLVGMNMETVIVIMVGRSTISLPNQKAVQTSCLTCDHSIGKTT